MSKIKSILGYAWAAICLLIVLATFLGNGPFSQLLARASFMKINPKYTGGEVARTIDHGQYKTHIHHPVFAALIGESETGFVQIAWEPVTALPPVIEEKIDYNGDGKSDFSIKLESAQGRAELKSDQATVGPIAGVFEYKKGWRVRVHLKRPS
ncbi:MAG: hypothetical protein AB1641_07425 [Thermodesulfobacteriota bacterium]